MYRSIASYFWSQVENSGSRTAVIARREGAFVTRSWREVAVDVRKLVAALRRMEVAPGDCVAQISENRYEWIVVDMALHTLGAIHVPIHSTLSGPQIAYQIHHCGTRCALFSTDEQARKLDAAALELPGNVDWIGFDSTFTHVADRPIVRWHDIMLTNDPGPITCHVAEPNDVVTILYTSGTTGEPKGVMLTQDNLVSNTLGVLNVLPQDSNDLRLCFLPLSHIFARTCDLYSWVVAGTTLALAESRHTVERDAAELHPTVFNAVPYFYDRLMRSMIDAGRGDPTDSVHARLGGRTRVLCGGGAALPEYVFDFFEDQGSPVLLGYGLTETSPVISVSTPTAYRRGASGKVIERVEVRIADDGELLTRGPHVMAGYYRDPIATRQVIQDGWFHTGDLGRVDEDGFVWITGRKKELIVTLGGKNIAPVLLESLLTQDPLIHQAMVVGDGQKYLAALIVPDLARLKELMPTIPPDGPELEPASPELHDLYARRIGERLAGLAPHEQVRRFAFAWRPFTIEAGELTPKLSLRREAIARNFTAEMASLYDDPRKEHAP